MGLELASICPSTLSNMTFSETSWPIVIKFHLEHHWGRGWIASGFGLDRIRTLVSPGRQAQSVTCLATDVCLTADPGIASSIPARNHTFVEIDHEIISTVILLPSADLFKKGCCQLQAKVCAQITG